MKQLTSNCYKLIFSLLLLCSNLALAINEPNPFLPFGNAIFSGDATTASAFAAQKWSADNGTSPVSVADTPRGRVMKMPCDITNATELRCAYIQSLSSLNFAIYKEFKIDIYVADTAAVDRVTLYFGSGSGIFGTTVATQLGLQTLTFKVADFYEEVSGGSWSSINWVKLSPWAKSRPANTTLEVINIRAISRSSVAVLADAPNNATFYKNTTTILNQGFIANDSITTANIDSGYLSPTVTKMLILPSNTNLTTLTQTKINAFTSAGGKTFNPSSNDFNDWKVMLNDLTNLVPSIANDASIAAYDTNSRVSQYLNYTSSRDAIRANETNLPTAKINQIENDFTQIENLKVSYDQARTSGLYTNAIDIANQMNPYLRDAYALNQAMGASTEFRGIWSHDSRGPYPNVDNWPESIRLLKDAGFNAVISGVSGAGFAAYDSTFIPYSTYYQGHGDQLAALISAAHAAGIKVHAWDLVWNLFGADHPLNSVSTPNNDWYNSLVRDGRLMGELKNNSVEAMTYQTLNGVETSYGWLSPCHGANRELKKKVLLDIASRYEVDGIHLDYNRANGSTTMFEVACKPLFEAKIGRQITNWPAEILPSTTLGAEYADWRASVITSFTKELKVELDKVNDIKKSKGQPKVVLSASVFNEYDNSRIYNAQDWLDWIRQGIVDQLHPMDYTQSYPVFTDWLQRQTAKIDAITPGFPFYPGIMITETDYTSRSDASIDQILATRGDSSGTVTQRRAAGGFTLYNFGNGFMASDSLASFAKGVTANKTAAVADINISATIDAAQQIVAGSAFNYTLAISNSGADTATSTEVNITVPPGMTAQTISASTGNCSNVTNNIKCDLGAIASGSSGWVKLSLVSSVPGTYQIDSSARSANTDPNSANNFISKKIAVNSNVALNKPVYTSSDEKQALSGGKAVDGIVASYSRWSSSWRGNESNSWKDDQYIYVDLGKTFSISRVRLNWEAYGSAYKIEISSDKLNWTQVYSTATGDGNIDDIVLINSVAARYVRMKGIKRARPLYGYSLFEFEVYGVPAL